MQQYCPDIRGGASVSKAMAFIEGRKSKDTLSNTTDMYKAWRKYKSVVHFLFPFALTSSNPQKWAAFNMFDGLGIVGFLAMSRAVQEWLLAFDTSRHSTKRRLVTKKDLWTVPALDLPQVTFKMEPFSDDEMKILKSRRR
jgi:hypothetical protein